MPSYGAAAPVRGPLWKCLSQWAVVSNQWAVSCPEIIADFRLQILDTYKYNLQSPI